MLAHPAPPLARPVPPPALVAPLPVRPERPSPVDPRQPGSRRSVTGRVLAPDGTAIAGALVQQQGGIAAATTDASGSFAITLDASGSGLFTITAVGYLAQQVTAASASQVVLIPVPVYRPAFAPLPPEPRPGPAHPFDTGLSLQYRVRNLALTSQGRGVTGLADNEIYGEARYRPGDWVLALKGYHDKVPFSVAGLSSQPSPAPEVDRSQWLASAGYAVDLGPLELVPQLAYSSAYVQNTTGMPWTGTPLDFSQTWSGFGVGLDAGVILGSWEILGEGQWVPSYATTASAAPYPVGPVAWSTLGATLGYDVMPGLRLDLSYQREQAVGTNLFEGDDVYGLGLSYHPARILP